MRVRARDTPRAALCQGPGGIGVSRIAYFVGCVVAGLMGAYLDESRRRNALLQGLSLRHARHVAAQSRYEATVAAATAVDTKNSLTRYEHGIAYICHEVRCGGAVRATRCKRSSW
jgi:hypothetical protein